MIFVLKIVIYYLFCIFIASYMSLLERKIIARVQLRLAPTNCGVGGICQPIADGIKLFFKRDAFVGHSPNAIIGICVLFTTALCQLTIIPIAGEIFSIQYGAILIILTQSIIVFSEVLIGTSSNSKYGIIGGNRAYLQNLGGHLSLMLLMLIVIKMSSGTNLINFISMPRDMSFYLHCIPLAILFFITILITGSRVPFDFTEAESELVGGAYVEYGGILFGMIYLADYLNLLFLSFVFSALFLSDSDFTLLSIISLFVKTICIVSIVTVMRAILPRYKQEQMIRITWKILIPAEIILGIM